MHQLATRQRIRHGSMLSKHRGSVTLEFLLVMPVLLIVLLAVIQFGMFFANMQQVAVASRVGADAAAQYLSLPYGSATVPADVSDRIHQQLSSSGITPCRIILEHNVTTPETLTTTYGTGCSCAPPETLLPPGGARSVRLTVCVPMTELAPNVLSLLGLDLTGRHIKRSTTFRYELSTP